MRDTPLEMTQKYAHGIHYPVSKEEAVEMIARNGAPQDVIALLKAAPYDRFTQAHEIQCALWHEMPTGRFRGDRTANSPHATRGSKVV